MSDEPRPDDAAAASTSTVAEPPAQGEEEAKKKLHQEVAIRDVGPCKKHIKVTVARDDLDHRLQEKFKELVVDSNVAGFRPGKAPRKVVERRYHKEVSDQVKAEVLLQSLEQLAEEHDVAPLAPPDIDPFKIELPREGPMIYEFEVEVRPQFDLPQYKGLKLKRPVRTFTDADVAEEERRLLAPYGQVAPKDDLTVELGDLVTTDITIRLNDQQVSRLAEQSIRVESRLVFKDGIAERFGAQLKGARPGEKRQVDISLSQNAAQENLRGQTVQATFEIKDVKTLRLPELTHEFLHTFGVHSVEQFHELLRVFLQRRLEYQQRQSARDQVLAQIESASSWELPRDLLARQARKALARKVMEMQSEGISEEEIKSRESALRQDILRSTAQSLKEHFVMQKVAEAEKLDATEDDIQEEIERLAHQADESPRRVRARLEKDELMDTLAAEIIERKALDLILDSAEYEDIVLDQPDDSAATTVEEQTVPGEMQDPTAPPEEEPSSEAPPPPAQS
jgi:trigger factor